MKTIYLKISFILILIVVVFFCSKDDNTIIIANQAQKIFILSNVINNAINISLRPTLNYQTATDSNEGILYYDVYLDQNTEPSAQISENLIFCTTHKQK